MTSYTAQYVADLEADVEVARTELESLKLSNAMLMQERDAYKYELVQVRAERDSAMAKATEMRTIIRQTSVQLVEAIKRMETNDLARQERNLNVGEGDSPHFLRHSRRHVEQSRVADDATKADRQPRAEKAPITAVSAGDMPLLFEVPARQYARVRTDIVDDRLPPVMMTPRDLDADNLRKLANDIGY